MGSAGAGVGELAVVLIGDDAALAGAEVSVVLMWDVEGIVTKGRGQLLWVKGVK